VTASEYLDLKFKLIDLGYGHEITWAETVAAPKDAEAFACEACFVICNSGMKAQVARRIHDRVWYSLQLGNEITDEKFGHKGKRQAIQWIYDHRHELFSDFTAARDKVAYCASLPWIGGITKFHLAKNLGVDCCKPDRHLVRIAKLSGETPDQLCSRLAAETGNRIGCVDLVIWRCANLKLIATPVKVMQLRGQVSITRHTSRT
jgi:hypothetical protein